MSQQVASSSGSSFHMAMRILPREKREAMYSVYRFCRAVDDIADGGGSSAQRLAELERWRADIAALFKGRVAPSLRGLDDAVRRYGLQQEDFDAVIDGMAMDAAGDIRAPEWAELDLYCDRVASAVGRLSVRIFGFALEPGEALAYHLGRALQLTNILRDIDEDAAIGRLYLPKEALAAADVDTDEPLKAAADPRLANACSEVAARARQHFHEARRIMAGAPRAAARAPRLMAAAYRSILDGMVAVGFEPPRRRVSASRLHVLGALLVYGLI
jgi:presqualene diphosphate synthase